MTNLARITGGDINTLIPATTRIFGDWSIATDKQSETLDFLFRVQQNTGIGIDALAEKVVQFGAPLRQMGFSFEEATALIGKWEKEGVNAELVLGSLRIALAKFASAGVKDTNAALLELIDRVKNAGSTGEATGIAIEAFGRKAGPDMAAAIREGRFDLDTLLKQLKTGTDTINGVALATDDWMEKLKKLKNNAMIELEPVANKVFNSLTVAVDRLSPKIKDLAAWFGKLSDSQMDNLLKWGLIIAAIGPALSIIGRTMTGVIQLTNNIKLLNAAIQSSKFLLGGAATAGLVAMGAATEALADKIDNQLVKTIANGLIPTMGGFIDIAKDDIEVARAMADGIISWKDAQDLNIFTIKEHIQKIREIRAEKEADLNATVNLANSTFNYTDALGVSTKSTDQYKVSLESMGKETGEATDETDDLYSSLFSLFLLTADGKTKIRALNDAYAAYTEAVKTNGKASDEATTAKEDWIRQLDIEIGTTLPALIAKTGDLTQSDRALLIAMDDNLNKAVNAGVITRAQMEETRAQINYAIQGSINKDLESAGVKFDELGAKHIKPTVELVIDGAMRSAREFQQALDNMQSKTVSINTVENKFRGTGWANGGMVSASKGINLPKFDNGGVLAMLHPPEVVLNGKQALNMVWNMAQQKDTKGGKSTPSTINIYPETSVDLTTQSNIRIIKQAVAEVMNA